MCRHPSAPLSLSLSISLPVTHFSLLHHSLPTKQHRWIFLSFLRVLKSRGGRRREEEGGLGNGSGSMDFWPEFLATSWGKEFVAGGLGGIAGVVSGYPLDSLRILQQSSMVGSAVSIFRRVIATEGPAALYRGMAAPLVSVTFQVHFPFSRFFS